MQCAWGRRPSEDHPSMSTKRRSRNFKQQIVSSQFKSCISRKKKEKKEGDAYLYFISSVDLHSGMTLATILLSCLIRRY